MKFKSNSFKLLKTKFQLNLSVADEVGKLLNISSDSAYRRMRSEKQITFEEAYTLANHFKISLDQLMSITTGGMLFQGNIVNEKNYGFEQYLTGMLHTMAYFNSFKNKELYYSCKDMPLFHHFYVRSLRLSNGSSGSKHIFSFRALLKENLSFQIIRKNYFHWSNRCLECTTSSTAGKYGILKA